MTKSELPLRLSAASVIPESPTGRDINLSEPEQSTSHSNSKRQPAPARDIPQESRELQEATAHLNATLDRSNNKMQKIIDKSRAQLPEQARLPAVPQLHNRKIPAPPGDCGCEEELYTSDGSQCYNMARSEIANLRATMTRGLKRKESVRETTALDDMAEVDAMWDGTNEKLRSPLAGGGPGSRPRRHPKVGPLSAADQAEQKMLQRHPDLSQARRQIMPLPSGRCLQQSEADDEADQRLLKWHPDNVSQGK